jgi:hypothetical protein
MNLESFKEAVLTLTEIKDDRRRSFKERVYALAELYFMFRGDVHAQATYVREIQDLTRG